MNYKELFRESMFYGQFDRMPVTHWAGWPETLERWYEEGLPRDADVHQFFDAHPHWAWLSKPRSLARHGRGDN